MKGLHQKKLEEEAFSTIYSYSGFQKCVSESLKKGTTEPNWLMRNFIKLKNHLAANFKKPLDE